MGGALPTDTLSPTSLSFPSTAMGSLSSAQTVTLSNSGDVPLTSIAVAVSGPFQISNNFTTQLTGKSSCAISVIFAPTAIGQQNGMLSISDVLKTQTVSLSGVGSSPPTLSFSPSSLNFMGQPLGIASSVLTLTLNNGGASPESNLSFSITGGFAGDFSMGTTTCAAILPSGGSCTIPVTFTPSTLGNEQAFLMASSSTESVHAMLSGAGFDFTVSASGGQTVSSGQRANYALTITSLSELQGDFDFACGTLPAHAGCTFSSTVLTVSGGATGTESLSVNTSSTSARNEQQPMRRRSGFALACGLVLLPFVWRRRQKAWLAMLLVATSAIAVLSCSSSGGGTVSTPPGSGSGNTAAGTYLIPVIVRANGVQHSVPLTLVVD